MLDYFNYKECPLRSYFSENYGQINVRRIGNWSPIPRVSSKDNPELFLELCELSSKLSPLKYFYYKKTFEDDITYARSAGNKHQPISWGLYLPFEQDNILPKTGKQTKDRFLIISFREKDVIKWIHKAKDFITLDSNNFQ